MDGGHRKAGRFFIYALREEESPGFFICGSTLGPLSKLCSTGEGSTGYGEADSPPHYSDLLYCLQSLALSFVNHKIWSHQDHVHAFMYNSSRLIRHQNSSIPFMLTDPTRHFKYAVFSIQLVISLVLLWQPCYYQNLIYLLCDGERNALTCEILSLFFKSSI